MHGSGKSLPVGNNQVYTLEGGKFMCIFYRICERVCIHKGTGKDTPSVRKREGEKRHKKCLGEHFPQLEVIIKTAGAVFTALLLGLHFVCQADSRATPAVTMMCACVRVYRNATQSHI